MHEFELIAAGEIDAAGARSILAELPRDLDLDGARKLFSAFRAWTWKALDQKRRDPELREWHDLMKRAQVRTKTYDRVVAQLQVLLDLIHESLAVAMRLPASDVLKRRNAKIILSLLRDGPSGQLSKQELMDGVGIKHANLSRLMNVLMGAGLVERRTDGREALFRLSRAGQEQAAELDTLPALIFGDSDAYGRRGPVHYGSRVDAHAARLQREMLDVLGSKLTTKVGKMWIASFDRADFSRKLEAVHAVKKVGAAYFGNEHNLYGGPQEVGKVLVVGRPESDRYMGGSGSKHYGFAGLRQMVATHG